MAVAVVGGGISGLAAAYVLAKEGVMVVVYEKEDALGGHAKTVTVDGTVLDIGSLTFSQVTNPDIMELFESLGVGMELSDMSFSVSLDIGRGYEWGTRNGLSSLFAQKKNALSPCFWKMIREVDNFKNDASIYVEKFENDPDLLCNETLGDFVQSRGYSEFFQQAFLIPICACIWPSSSGVLAFSAHTVLSFLCKNHLLELFGCLQKHTTQWNIEDYVHKVKKELETRGCQIRANTEVLSVSTIGGGCVITCKDGKEELYDQCILTIHAPEALIALGKEVTYDELRILGAFQYANSDFTLHHDSDLMPKNQAIWSSINYMGTTDDKAYITYWLNNIQGIDDAKLSFFLTPNAPHVPKSAVSKLSMRWPIPSIAASKASSQLSLIQGKRQIWFCGAYQGYGFLEDGLKAGIVVANNLLRNSCTLQNHLKCIQLSWPQYVARLLVTRFFKQFIVEGCLTLLDESGMVLTFCGGRQKRSNLKSILKVNNPQFYWKVATEADIGFADAYINGDFCFVDKNGGLLNCLMIFIVNSELHTNTSKLDKKRGWWMPKLYTSIIASTKYFIKHLLRPNSVSRARRNISLHYDLSNELFALFLDETMTYSCAIFEDVNEDLKTAQLRKVHALIRKGRITKDHHVLEIGCGWGSLAFEAVKLTGCKYTGITLSEKQYQYLQEKVKGDGLQDQVEIILCDYRKLPNCYKYDRIISCGMIEHVGHEYMEEFFRCCESALAPNGILVLQFISIADEKYDEYRYSSGFIKEYIFPGGCTPSLSRVTSAMATGSRLSIVHLEEIGCHYFYTLHRWCEKFLHNQSEVLALGFDEKFIRTWEYYLIYCATLFKLCMVGDYQIVMSRPGDVAICGNDPYNAVPGVV